MGMLDGLLGSLMGGMQGGGGAQQSPLLQVALQLMQQNGGLQGILAKFQQAGYGAQAGSWVSTGRNMSESGGKTEKPDPSHGKHCKVATTRFPFKVRGNDLETQDGRVRVH